MKEYEVAVKCSYVFNTVVNANSKSEALERAKTLAELDEEIGIKYVLKTTSCVTSTRESIWARLKKAGWTIIDMESLEDGEIFVISSEPDKCYEGTIAACLDTRQCNGIFASVTPDEDSLGSIVDLRVESESEGCLLEKEYSLEDANVFNIFIDCQNAIKNSSAEKTAAEAKGFPVFPIENLDMVEKIDILDFFIELWTDKSDLVRKIWKALKEELIEDS